MEKLIWLLVFTLGYWFYCIFWGLRGARQTKTASDYFIAGRGIGIWVFVLAATATSFSGWTFVGHPGTIYSVGLPYAFASHFAPAALMQAIEIYRAEFKPSEQLAAPYVMAGFNVFAADSDEEADYLRSSSQQSFLNLRRGDPGPLPPPVKDFAETLSAAELQVLDSILSCSPAGRPETVRAGIAEFAERTGADELIVTSHIYDHDKRLRSFEIIAEVGIAKD